MPSISGVASTDVQALSLKRQIDDWATCPTTPTSVKDAKVSKLQAQLDTVVAADSKKEPNKGELIDLMA